MVVPDTNAKNAMKAKLQELKKYISGNFENSRHWGPRIAEGLIELEKLYEADSNKIEALEKKLQNIEDKDANSMLQDVEAILKKKVGAQIAYNVFFSIMKTPEGKKNLKELLEANSEVIKSEFELILQQDKGIVSNAIKGLRRPFIKMGAIGLVLFTLLTVGGISGTMIYIANNTTVGKYIGAQNKIDDIEKVVFVPKKNRLGKIIGYEDKSRIDSLAKEIADYKKENEKSIESRLSPYILRTDFESMQKGYEQKLKQSEESYDKKVSEIQATTDSYKKYSDELKKSNEENAEKLKNLEKRVEKYEKSNKGIIRKILP